MKQLRKYLSTAALKGSYEVWKHRERKDWCPGRPPEKLENNPGLRHEDEPEIEVDRIPLNSDQESRIQNQAS